MEQPQILLAYGERGFSKKLREALEKSGSRVSILTEGDPPKARYNLIFQLAGDPANVAEGTRLLLDKAKRDRSRLLFVSWRKDAKLYEEAARFARTLLEEASRKGEAEISFLNLGRIYGPGVDPAESGALGHLVTEFAQGNVLTLYGGGEDEDYYLFVEDALEGLALAPEHAQSGETYALSPSIPVTSEAAANLLFELGGGRHEIGFHRGISASEDKEKVAGMPLPEFKIKTSFNDGILAILKNIPPAPIAAARKLPRFRFPLLRLPHLKWKFPRFSRRSLKRAGVILLILSPLLYLTGEIGWSALQLNRTKIDFQDANFSAAQTALGYAAASLGRLAVIFPSVRPLVEISQAAREISTQGAVLTKVLDNLVKSRRGEEIDPQSTQDFQSAQVAFAAAEQHLEMAWLEAQQIETGFLQKPAEELQGLVKEGIKITRLATSFLEQAEEVLGYNGARNYLILFQNSAEARAGGGFMGSFAWATLDYGGISRLQFFDGFDLNIAGKVSPPSSIAKLRGSDGLSFRELNFFASFPTSARKIEEVFESVQDVKIDGVIGMTLTFAKDILEVAGEIALPDFGQTVSAQNLFEVTTREVEQDFFPGTTKKKRFLQALGEALIGKLFSLGKESYAGIAKAAWQSVGQKNLLVYLNGGPLAQDFYDLNFDGHVDPTLGDYLFVLDTSYAKKINEVWLKRRVDYEVKNINRRGTLYATATITWEHTGTEAWPSGTYVNLLRVLVPQGSVLREAELNGKNYFSKVFTTQEAGKTEFAAYLKKINPQSTTTLKLTYRLPKTLNALGLERYTLVVQKQPGTVGDGFGFIFEEPFGSEAQSSDLQKQDNRLIFEGNLTRDWEFEINLKER